MRPDVNLMRQNESDLVKVETELVVYIFLQWESDWFDTFSVVSMDLHIQPITIVWMLIAFQTSLTYWVSIMLLEN